MVSFRCWGRDILQANHLIWIVAIAIFFRLFVVSQTIFGDEFGFLENVRLMGPYGLNPITVSSLLVPWIHWIEAQLFGLTTIALKFGSLFFSILTLLLIYDLAKRMFGKKAALVSAFLYATSAYAIFNSMLVDSEGAHITFFITLAIYFFYRFVHEGKTKWFVLCALGVGLSVLVKQTGFILLPIFFFYEWYVKKDFLKTTKHVALLGVVGAVFFSAYFLLSFIAQDTAFKLGTQHTFLRLTQPFINLKLSLIQHFLAFIWLGPLFLAFIYFAVRDWKKHFLPSLWAVFVFFVFVFVYLDATKPIDRYFGILVPPLCMIGGSWIAEQKFIKEKKALIWAFVISMILFLALNNLPGEYLPFYPKEEYINRALDFDFSFMMPISGGSGPIGFFLHAVFVVGGFALAGILFVASQIRKKNKKLLLAFLGCAFAFNIIVMSEHLWSVSNPDIDAITKDAIDFARQNELKQPLFAFRNPAFRYYLEDIYGGPYKNMTILDYYVFDRENIAEMIENQKPTVLIVDFPMINRESDFWKAIEKCELLQTFEDKGLKAGYVFDCA